MAIEPVVTGTSSEDEYAKPNPQENPRNIALGEIAKTVAVKHVEDAAETAATIDDEGNITPASPPEPALEVPPPSEAAAEPAAAPSRESVPEPAPVAPLDPNKLYKVKVDGQEMEVKGSAIIDAGYRTFQKETAADFRLKLASELLREAEVKAQEATPKGAPVEPEPKLEGKTDTELANALQFGTLEQAAEALKEMRGRGAATPEQISQFAGQQARIAAQDELQFQDAMKFVQAEYEDLLSNDYLKRMFFVEENRRRASKERGGEADRRPYRDLYKSIGDDLRKAFDKPKPAAPGQPIPAGTVAARTAIKQNTPPVPRTAASRIKEGGDVAKVPTPSELIASMAEKRGQTRLSPQTRKGT